MGTLMWDPRLYRTVFVALLAMLAIVTLTLAPPYLGIELEWRQVQEAYQWIAMIALGAAAKSAAQHSSGAVTGVIQALFGGARRDGPWQVGPGATASRTGLPPLSPDDDTDHGGMS